MRSIGRKGPAVLLGLTLGLAVVSGLGNSAARVKTLRVPDGGLQPQVAVDEKGIVHLLYEGSLSFAITPGCGTLLSVQAEMEVT